MLNDAELQRLRDRFFQAGVGLTYVDDETVRLAWGDVLHDMSTENLGVLLSAIRGTPWRSLIASELVEIGMAVASDVLMDIPSTLDRAGDRRWQLRRELARVVSGMDVEQLQRLVYWSRSIADV